MRSNRFAVPGLVALAGVTAAIAWADPKPAPPQRRPQPHIPGAIALRPPACDVQLVERVDTLADGTRRISTAAVNRTKAAVSFSAPGHCPGGAVQFSGLPAGYDYYRTCNMGECVADPPLSVSVPAGGSVDVATIELAPKATTCTKPLAPGTYDVVAHLPSSSPRVCDGTVQIVVAAPPAPPPPKPRKKTPPKHAACKPMPACGLGCPGPFAHDADGCAECACERVDPPTTIRR